MVNIKTLLLETLKIVLLLVQLLPQLLIQGKTAEREKIYKVYQKKRKKEEREVSKIKVRRKLNTLISAIISLLRVETCATLSSDPDEPLMKTSAPKVPQQPDNSPIPSTILKWMT